MRKNLVSGVIILTISSLIIKILGFVFRIFLSNKIGSEGMGLYQLILSVYALGATISSSGVHVAISKLVAIDQKNSKRILKTALSITLVLGFTAFLVTFLNAENIGLYFLKDERSIIPLKIVSASFPIISIFSCLSGYFYGLTEVKFPILGQIVEQLVRIGVIFLLIDFALLRGISNAIVLTSVGILLGEFFSMLYLYLKYKKTFKNRYIPVHNRWYIAKILAISIPISISGYFSSFLHTIENILIPIRLSVFGYTHQQAISALGLIKGMVMPLIFFPTVLLTSVATIALPTISYAKANHQINKIKYSVKNIFKLTFVTSVFVVFLFLFLGDQITGALYKSNEAAFMLKYLSLLSPMIYLSIVMGSILNGMGKQVQVMINGMIEGVIRILMIYFILPKYGVNGYIFSVIVSALLGTGLNLYLVFRECTVKFDSIHWLVNPILSAWLSSFIIQFLPNIYLEFFSFFALYVAFLILTGTIKWKDLLWIRYNIFKISTKKM